MATTPSRVWPPLASNDSMWTHLKSRLLTSGPNRKHLACFFSKIPPLLRQPLLPRKRRLTIIISKQAYRILVGKPEGKRPLGRPRRRLVDNIKMNFREIGWDGMDSFRLAQDREQRKRGTYHTERMS
jgi:hypothetical protein